MKNLTRIKKSRALSPRRLAASAVVLAAAVAAEIVAGQADAAPARFAPPRLDDGVLRIKGTHASDKIALRLQAGDPGVLQVDVGDDGSANFSFERNDIASISVHARPGDDSVRIDESNGVFTDAIPTTIDAGAGTTPWSEAPEQWCFAAGPEKTPWSEAPERRRCAAAGGAT